MFPVLIMVFLGFLGYTVRLVDRAANGVVVLDVSEGASSGTGGQFVGRLREAIEDVMGRPGERPQRRRIEPKTWRRKQEQEGGER